MAFYRPASWQKPLSLLLLCAALALPSALAAFGQEFYIGFATRVLIFALAASSLNLVLGFGGMVSLGHAAFLGAGAYAAAICQQAGINEALLAFPAAMGIAGLFALVVGAISLRTRGVYFIMITLAFAQMAYYLFISARSWGGDDGLPLNGRMTGRLQPGRRRGAVLCRSRTAGPRHAVLRPPGRSPLRAHPAGHPRKRNAHGSTRLPGLPLPPGRSRWVARLPAWPGHCSPT
jgi:hypothetical protein